MIDPKLLRQSAAEVAINLAKRGYVFDSAAYQALDERRKTLQVETQQLQSERKVEKTPGKWIWEPIKKTHSNNHLWDCEVMQVVAACMFKVLAATVEDD